MSVKFPAVNKQNYHSYGVCSLLLDENLFILTLLLMMNATLCTVRLPHLLYGANS